MCSTLIVQTKKGININCRVVDTCNEGLGEMFLSANSQWSCVESSREHGETYEWGDLLASYLIFLSLSFLYLSKSNGKTFLIR